MSEPEHPVGAEGDENEVEMTPGYKPPAQKALSEIVAADKEDEALEKYKKNLLGDVADGSTVIIDEKNPDRVIITKMEFLTAEKSGLEIDLTTADVDKPTFIIKEGIKYTIRIWFYVQRELVSGLRYHHSVKKSIVSDKESHMVGSYGPRKEIYQFTTPEDELPTGILARGSYTVHSKFVDDDKKIYRQWDWKFKIQQDWE